MDWCAQAMAYQGTSWAACLTETALQSLPCRQVRRAVSITWSTCSRRASVFLTHHLRTIGLLFAAASVFSTTNPKATLFSRSSTSLLLSNPQHSRTETYPTLPAVRQAPPLSWGSPLLILI